MTLYQEEYSANEAESVKDQDGACLPVITGTVGTNDSKFNQHAFITQTDLEDNPSSNPLLNDDQLICGHSLGAVPSPCGSIVNNESKSITPSCCTPESCAEYIFKCNKYERMLLISGLCFVITIALLIAFLTSAIVIPSKSPRFQEVNTTFSIKPEYFEFGGFDNYCILVEEISEFSNGKVTLSSNGGASKKATLAITKELLINIGRYEIANTTLKSGLIGPGHYEFHSYVINDYKLEMKIETKTGGILNVTQVRIDKNRNRQVIMTENITMGNESFKSYTHSSNESGFYQLYLRGYQDITGTLEGHISYNTCESNRSYPNNCSIGDTNACEVDVSSLNSGFILLILDAHKYEGTIFNITETGTIQVKDKDNARVKYAMFGLFALSSITLIGLLVIIVFLLQMKRGSRNNEQRPLIQ